MIHPVNDSGVGEFRRAMKAEFDRFLESEANKFPDGECLKIDLHCHDRNSDVPDQLWGRILGLPETWLKTKRQVKCLEGNGCDVVTITNHNNAKSCWKLLEKGRDVLVGAEFTCHFPEHDLFVHVLAYGFTPEQETVLNGKRGEVYGFLRYAADRGIPVILAHPLYLYTRREAIDPVLFEKLAVLFQRFEVLNGQRDLWQSVLTLNWVRGLTPEKIRGYAGKHRLDPAEFGVDPDRPKVLTGGSDDHMGIFAGECGSLLHVPGLAHRRSEAKLSELALEAIRDGRIAPFGHVAENQKLNIALLDYFSQAAIALKDPGLLRILFHRGEISDKIACLAIGNLMLEMRKNKNAQKFFGFVHSALQGKKPNKLVKWQIKKDYRFCVGHLHRIADSKRAAPDVFVETVNTSIADLFLEMNRLVVQRMKKNAPPGEAIRLESFSTEEIARRFEIPSQLSRLIEDEDGRKNEDGGYNVARLLDSLSFPVMISLFLGGAALASARLLYQNRSFLNDFAERTGGHRHPRRVLCLTDTLRDKNGVSTSLSAKLTEIQRRDLPLDFLICHPDAEPEPHLRVVRPLATFSAPSFGEQAFRVPNLLEIAAIFYEGGYDRVLCSTEGPMGAVSLFLNHMFNVPSFFFMHTDWLDFVKNTTDLNRHERDRIRRALRFLYRQYGGVFVLNNEHRDWLTGHEMQLAPENVFLTAHHARAPERRALPARKADLFQGAGPDTPVLFFASRLSREKGILDLPGIVSRARRQLPDLKIVIAGSGPAEEELRNLLPGALYLGWLDKTRIAELYLGLDLFIFPSRFDTFGNVVLEAFSYGMPVVAYDCKGPRDIVENNVSGYLVDDVEQMAERIVAFFAETTRREAMKRNALRRASDYRAEPIMDRFLRDLGVIDAARPAAEKSLVA
ncbi:MAG: glycosyltransferase [Gammaproteobacteria bacterium]